MMLLFYLSTIYRVSRKSSTRLMGCEIKSMRPIFKTEMLIYQSKANLDEKILFAKITRHLDPEIRKMLIRSMLGDKGFHNPCWSIIYLLLQSKFNF